MHNIRSKSIIYLRHGFRHKIFLENTHTWWEDPPTYKESISSNATYELQPREAGSTNNHSRVMLKTCSYIRGEYIYSPSV